MQIANNCKIRVRVYCKKLPPNIVRTLNQWLLGIKKVENLQQCAHAECVSGNISVHVSFRYSSLSDDEIV